MDGTNKYADQTIDVFAGLITSKEHKTTFPETATPYIKNFIMENGSLENRKGFLRVNNTAYADDVLFLIPYVNRDGTAYIFYGVG